LVAWQEGFWLAKKDTSGAGVSERSPRELEAENARLRQELERAREREARLEAVLESAADYAIFTTDPAGMITSWNAGACNLLGWDEAEALGMDGRLTFTPEDREQRAPETEMAKALAEGRAENERWHQRKDGSRFWGSGLLLPLRGTAAGGFLKVMRDETARREGDERQGLLIRELAHRVKNSLTLIMAMARQTGLRAADLDEFLGAFEGRLKALAAVHDLLSEEGWRSTPLTALVRTALAPHEGRVRLGRVADLRLKPAAAQDLVLALHELATNAAKHGALSAPEGHVALGGRVSEGELVLTWREAGGPPVMSPTGRGFGTTLLERVVTHQHKGRVELDWRPEGLVCTLILPLAEIADQAAGPIEAVRA
jgi:PAS domain S-box-containing protein